MESKEKEEAERIILIDFCNNLGEGGYEKLGRGLSERVINDYLKSKEDYYVQLDKERTDHLESLRNDY